MARILGLDPGSYHLGYGLIETRGSALRALAHGVVDVPRGVALAQRLRLLHEAVCGLLSQHPCDEVAVERVFTARNPASALVLGHARGVILLAAAQRALPIAEYAPAEVKIAVAGHGRCDKLQVAAMVARILELAAPAPRADATDALALAICHAGAWRIPEAARAQATGPRAWLAGTLSGSKRAHRSQAREAGGS